MPFKISEHTADLRVELEGRSFEELLLSGFLAVLEVLEIDASSPAVERVEINLRSCDREGLLADWLNELLFHIQTRGLHFACVEKLQIDGDELKAVLCAAKGGVKPAFEIKAATQHELKIEETEGVLHAAVVFDL
jgi:SHS2 domain-containing protein